MQKLSSKLRRAYCRLHTRIKASPDPIANSGPRDGNGWCGTVLRRQPSNCAPVSLGTRSQLRLPFRLLILTNGNWLPVAQLGPEFPLLGAAADHPQCDAVAKLESNSFAFSCY